MTLKPGDLSDDTQPYEFSGDASLAGLTPAERKVRVRERELEREERRRTDEKKSRDNREDAELRLHLALLAEAHRQAIRQLSNDIDDATTAARLALRRAGEEEDAARAALEDLQQNAIVVDGQRVYFSKSGALLGEDHREVTGKALDVARDFHTQRQKAPSFEEYKDLFDKCRDAEKRAQHLAEILDRLDELKEQAASGTLTPEELARSRQELDRIVSALPADTRDDYERLRSIRVKDKDIAYKAAPDRFVTGPDINAHFANAQHSAPEPDAQTPKTPEQEPTPLAYKAIP